jgi:hypothetical protein
MLGRVALGEQSCSLEAVSVFVLEGAMKPITRDGKKQAHLFRLRVRGQPVWIEAFVVGHGVVVLRGPNQVAIGNQQNSARR